MLTLRSTNGFLLAIAAAGCLYLPVHLRAGERIQFDLPTEAPDTQVDTGKIKPKNEGFFEPKKPMGGYTVMPQPARTTAPDDLDKKKNWLSPRPDGPAASPEEIFKVKGYGTSEEKPTTFLGQEIGTESRKKLSDSDKDKSARATELELQRNPKSAGADTEGLWSGTALLPGRKDFFGERPATFSDLWDSKFSARDLMDQNRYGYGYGSQPNGTRPVADSVNVFSDATRQEANPVVGRSTDFMSRSSQTSVADQWKNGGANVFAGERAPTVEDVNARSLGRNPAFDTPQPAPVTIKAQPAVLPFPTRPGDLFARPH